MAEKIKNVVIDPSQLDTTAVDILRKKGISISASDEKTIVPHYRDGKKTLRITEKKGETMDTCATISEDYVCCNVKVLKSVSNCPFDCSYCFLQNYLNDGTTSVIGDVGAMMTEVKEKMAAEPGRFFRIGTWELGDSLALEDHIGQAQDLIKAFSELDMAVLELKTKSDIVDPILHCEHKGKTVVSWSMNSDYIIRTQEHKTASLNARLAAIKKVVDAGYLVGFHFDPMIYYNDWKEGYTDLIQQIANITPPEQIAWISMGSLRFNPEMKQKMEENFPAQTITTEEMVKGPDGKVRYVKPLRLEMYRHFYNEIKKAFNCTALSPLDPPEKNTPLFYFCMERWDVWDTITGNHPTSINHLDYLFAHSLHHRYGLGTLPLQKNYQ